MTSWAYSVAADVVLGTLDQRCWVRLGHYLGLEQDWKTREDLKERFWDCYFIIPIWIAPLSFMKTYYLPSAGIGTIKFCKKILSSVYIVEFPMEHIRILLNL